MEYTDLTQPIILITVCVIAGFFLGFFSFMFTFKAERENLESDIMEFTKQINKLHSND